LDPQSADERSADPGRVVEVERVTVYEGRVLTLRRDRVRLPDGRETTCEVVVHPGGAVAVPVLDDGRLMLERQFRYAIGRAMLEFPAGRLDPGESALATAQRELVEETGYAARDWTHLATLHTTIGYSTEQIEVFLAEGLTPARAQREPMELIDIVLFTEDELLGAFDRGELTDGKSVGALFALQRHRARRTASGR
jgi:ADP-ribose pyrophosphatase